MNQEILTLQITDMAFGGKGIARLDGKVFFVDGALAGDTVKAIVEQDKKKYAEAKAIEIVTPSPDRVEVSCKHQAECGGCRLMPGNYEKQLQWKQSFVLSALNRIGKFSELPGLTMVASPTQLNYRNRIFLRARLAKGKLSLGYTGLDHHSLLAIDSCIIAEGVINDVMIRMLQEDYTNSDRDLNFRIQLQRLLNEKQEEIVTFTIYPSGAAKDQLANFMTKIQAFYPKSWIGFANETRQAPVLVFDQFADLTFYTKPGIFQQVNRAANRLAVQILHDQVQQATSKRNTTKILDLCSGSGNLSLMLARSGFEVLGTESNPLSIELAKINVEQNQIQNAQYICDDSNQFVRKLSRDKAKFDVILIDPPREGLKDAIKDIVALDAQDLFYLSCEPSTLARDLSVLTETAAHHVESIHCFDFFPHTWHVETLVHLRKDV